jgi:hypothetical protein
VPGFRGLQGGNVVRIVRRNPEHLNVRHVDRAARHPGITFALGSARFGYHFCVFLAP